LIESVNRIAAALSAHPNEASPWIYGIRLLAYTLILLAIVEKNRQGGRVVKRMGGTSDRD
jgi:hypothetical protein